MDRQLKASVAKMKSLSFYHCFLTFTVFLPLLVLSRSSLKNEQSTQNYWVKKGDEEIESALNLKRNNGVAKNVILFIADGMGPNTLTASRIYNGGESSQFVFENFPHVGLLKTYNVDRTVPESASTATALFSGIKTNFDISGLDGGVLVNDCQTSLDPKHKLTNIIHWAQDAGKDTGFVTTTRVTHATPSALYSHAANRKWECEAVMPASASKCKDIARQLIEDKPGQNLKVIMGGGLQCLTWNITNKPNDPIDTWSCKRGDARDLISVWKEDKKNRQKTYQYVTKKGDLDNIDYDKTDFLMGIFANGHISFEDSRDKSPEGMPSLQEMTAAAIKMLRKNKNGFVLVVEGGMIDQAHHRGFARRALEETVSLNNAVAEAINMTGDDTLIIVTSDHAHSLNINGNTVSGRNNILGIAMNSEIDGIPYTVLSYSTGGSNNYQYEVTDDGKFQRTDPTAYNTSSYDYSQQAGILNDEAKHGGADVAVFAKGPMAHLFHGMHEQTYVAYVIAYSAKMGKYSNRTTSHGSYHSNSFILFLFVVVRFLVSQFW